MTRAKSTTRKPARATSARVRVAACPFEGDVFHCPHVVETFRKMRTCARSLSNDELDEELRRRGLL